MSSSNMKNYIIAGIVGVILGFVLATVLSTGSDKTGAVSPNGTYNNTTGYAQITFTPSTSTSTSILNSGASDRAVIAEYGFCSSIGTSYTYSSGAGLATWTLQSATTSSANAGFLGNTNYLFNTTVATGTATGLYYASSTGASSVVAYIWPVGTYLTFGFNATNTASCSLGVSYNPL